MPHPFHTIGHSTHPLDDFIGLLRAAEIACLVDVRTVPRSRTNPQFNGDTLPDALGRHQIGYEHIAALGGLRGKAHDVAPQTNGFWENASFHNYADYAMGDDFHTGLARLRDIGHAQRCAIMCAEQLWWRCHRRIIADYLLAAGESVLHIMGPGKIEPAHLTEGARPDGPGRITYPALL